MTSINDDGNLLGRFLALAVLGLAVAGAHKLACGGGSCPLMSEKAGASCCSGAVTASAAPAAAEAAPAAAKKAKPAAPSAAAPAAAGGDSKASIFVELP